MRKSLFSYTLLLLVWCLTGTIVYCFSAESSPPVPASTEVKALVTHEAVPAPSKGAFSPVTGEAAGLVSKEALPRSVTAESSSPLSKEAVIATAEAASGEVIGLTEEGASYKGIPWGADFSTFKTIKNFPGNLAPLSAAFIGSLDDNDVALLLGVPVSDKEISGGQRVMFEFVPRKFASVFYEPDDTYYIFYNGKFALTLSKINAKNFDLYRDTFYKKYRKLLDYSKKFEPAKKNYYTLQAAIFTKGKTDAFLVKSEFSRGQKVFASAKLVFASTDLLSAIRKEIDEKMAAEKLSTGEKDKQDLQKDLNKIE